MHEKKEKLLIINYNNNYYQLIFNKIKLKSLVRIMLSVPFFKQFKHNLTDRKGTVENLMYFVGTHPNRMV